MHITDMYKVYKVAIAATGSLMFRNKMLLKNIYTMEFHDRAKRAEIKQNSQTLNYIKSVLELNQSRDVAA